MKTDKEMREDWHNSEVCNELRFNIEGSTRYEQVKERQENVADYFLKIHQADRLELLEYVKGMRKVNKLKFFGNNDAGYYNRQGYNQAIADFASHLEGLE